MTDETQVIQPNVDSADGGNGSRVFNVSIRAWISIVLVATVCAMSFTGLEVKEPLYTMASLAIGFYFGQKGSVK